MRTQRKLAGLWLAIMIIVSLVAMPATAYAQENEVRPQITLAETKVVNWETVLNLTTSDALANFEPGEMAANPGPLIAWLDRYVGVRKMELRDNSATSISGPAIYWGNIDDPEESKRMMAEGIICISCDGTFNGTIGEIGTGVMVIGENVTVTINFTGAVARLKNFNGEIPEASQAFVMTSEVLGFPRQCLDAEVPSTVGELNALVETAGPLYKVSGRDHFYTMYRVIIPSDQTLVIWTTGTVHGATLIAIDPGSAYIYQAEHGMLVVEGSFQGVALCTPVVADEEDAAVDDTLAQDGLSGEWSCPANAAGLGFVPVADMASMLEQELSFEEMKDCFPKAVVPGPLPVTNERGLTYVLLTNTSPNEEIWHKIGMTNGPFGIIANGDIPAGMEALALDTGLNPECDLDYWPQRGENCTEPATE